MCDVAQKLEDKGVKMEESACLQIFFPTEELKRMQKECSK